MGLKDKYKDYFDIGSAVNVRTIEHHSDLILQNFNQITFENEMKYDSFFSEPAIYRFYWPDRLYDFAKKNCIKIHGHVFVWHRQTPDFVFENKNRDELLSCLRLHMKVVGNRYKDNVVSWDIVNEAIDDDKTKYLRDTKWLKIIGDDYIDQAFAIAKETLPGIALYYNDYDECSIDKKEKILRLIKGLRSRNVPIDGIGLQSHYNIYKPDIDSVKRAIDEYAKTGLRIKISELDVSMYDFNDHTTMVGRPTEKMYEKQAIIYDELFKIYREYKEVIDSVSFWGIADDETWLDNFPVKGRKNWPLLFNEDHSPKEAYERIMNF